MAEITPGGDISDARTLTIISASQDELEGIIRFGEQAGFVVTGSTDIALVQRSLFDSVPDYLIIDLPAEGGVGLCRSIASFAEFDRVHVLVIVPENDTDYAMAALDTRADDFLVRPLQPSKLLARIHAGDRSARLKRELEDKTREMVRYGAELELSNRKLAATNRKLNQLTRTDDLTGLHNRRAAMESAERLWSGADRYDRRMSAIILDIDHFKQINDVHGHDAGDKVLMELAVSLALETRGEEPVYRIGGEEFLVLCDGPARNAAQLAERLRRAIEETTITCQTTSLSVTISAGVAGKHDDMMSPADLLRAADRALYAAKAAGRNCVRVIGPNGATLPHPPEPLDQLDQGSPARRDQTLRPS